MNRNSIGACTRCVQRRLPSATTYYRPGLRRYSLLYSDAREANRRNALSLSRRKVWSASSSVGKPVRPFATASSPQQGAGNGGPIEEYDRRVKADLLRDDAHQRSMLCPFLL
jgi:hypothetical protein